jgi:hypothetical protein
MTGTEFGFVGIPPELDSVGGIPEIGVSGYNNMGTGPWRPQYQAPDAYQILDVLTMARGPHAIKTGFEFRHRNNEFVDVQRRNPEYDFTGRFTGDAVADLLLGYADAFLLNNLMVAEQLQDVWAGFIQDDWKLRPNLTVNLGLRYEYATPYWARDPNPNINIDLATGNLVTATGDNRYLVDKDTNNWAPRLGVAYQIKPDRLVMRAGYGIFYGAEEFRGSSGNLVLNPPNLIQLRLSSVGNTPAIRPSDPVPGQLVQQYNPADGPNIGLQVREQQQDAVTIHQWNVAMEFALPWSSIFEVAYVGNRGRNLPGTFQLNQTPFGVDGSVAANRPYPQWGGIELYQTLAQSSYDSLQMKFERRFSNGWYNLTSYTFADALSETGGFAADNTPQVGDDWRSERARESQTPRHRLSIANIYQLPFGRGMQWGSDMHPMADFFLGGWQLSAIYLWQSGLPVNVSLAGTGVDPLTGRPYEFLNRNGGSLRPDIVGDPETGQDPGENRFNFLDANAYRVQAINTPGNAPRNSAIGPTFYTLDLGLVKRFHLPGQNYFDFRFEMFNAFNSTRYRGPNGEFGSPSFGIINDAFDPRIIQLALRYAF